ncbi:berberine bridge enzyme-like 15 [Rhododendron vialii]|uniref:berberine bridge enzyme-like 15 n=1 Tax=Rhododendron vialii TaxID=182163 RepID=UPI00265E339F|nr:berberine bridge enzyme-like 15 [Rhododendron vialii]
MPVELSNRRENNMGISNCGFLTLVFLLCISTQSAISELAPNNFLECFHSQTNHSVSNSSSNVIFTTNSSSYTSVLQSSAQNLRFVTASTPKPQLIIRPLHESHIQAAVICSRKNSINIRIRSGGHDYEGLSYYASNIPFIIVDLANLRSIKIDVENKTAWVESGATLGELYHAIAEESNIYGFPAGSCSTMGVGGHLAGGGFGTIFRKYGLAADNVIDARIVDVNGRIIDRKSMGEELFWAIRGGGGASFGIIFAWKIKLVPVPSIVTVFTIHKTLEPGATKLLQTWQLVADKLSDTLFLDVVIAGKSNNKIAVSFRALFLGVSEELLTTMEKSFPELGVERKDCTEMSWIQSVLHFADFSTRESYDVLLNRTNRYQSSFKAKSDYVKEPISEKGLEGLWKILGEEKRGYMIWTPYGGRMSEFSEFEIPFPHRSGNLYLIQYMVTWKAEEETEEHVNWIRRLYEYMTPFVSKNPRSAYLNYRDLDLGINRNENESYGQASVWGLKYFNSNFKRLAQIKAEVDPSDFFWYEQSIPLFLSLEKMEK